MIQPAAITDEFSHNLDIALPAMAECGMTGAELRVLNGKNIMDLSDAEIDEATAKVHAHGMKVISIASPLLKCVLPNAPEIDTRFQQDVFAAKHTVEDQPSLTERAFEIAERTGAKIIRVFSYWRTLNPDACFDRIATALSDLAAKAEARGLIIGIENEHACNISTGADTAKLLAAVPNATLQVVWDPANAYVAGESPIPEGYAALPKNRIIHVHAKDCRLEDHKPIWGLLGDMDLDWPQQIRALQADGYQGYVSLETHWPGPGGDKLAGSKLCGRNLARLLSQISR